MCFAIADTTVGIRDNSEPTGGFDLRADIGATAVANAFRAFKDVTAVTPELLDSGAAGNQSIIEGAINGYRSVIQPGESSLSISTGTAALTCSGTNQASMRNSAARIRKVEF